MSESTPDNKHYYVDEAGDAVLFAKRGKLVLDTPGCSRHFAVGLLDVSNPVALSQSLTDLRLQLLADPYFKNVPSMQPAAGKTAVQFHAKDDLPEVRREVYKVLIQQSVRFFAVVRDKRSVLDEVQARNQRRADYRYTPNELYDSTVSRLFKDRLHKHGGYKITFAIRGSRPRTEAFQSALIRARTRFEEKWGIVSAGELDVKPVHPTAEPALQATDYFLWALQRTYERREDRFLELIWPLCSLIIDVDDTREAKYGVYYTRKKPLRAAALKNG